MNVETAASPDISNVGSPTAIVPERRKRPRGRIRSARISVVAGIVIFLAVNIACHRGIDDGADGVEPLGAWHLRPVVESRGARRRDVDG